MLIAFSATLLRNGPPEGYSLATTTVISGLFWLGGLILVAFAIRKPCYYASIQKDELTLTWRYPHRTVRTSFPTNVITPPVVIEGRDSEGDPYFFARLILPNGNVFDLAESHIRSLCEDACKSFLLAVQKTEDRLGDVTD